MTNDNNEPMETGLTIFSPDTFINIAVKPVTDEQAKILLAETDVTDLDILPTGEVYLTQAKYRQRLNVAFGPGGWAMRPLSSPYIKDDFAMQEWAMYANGQFIAYAVGGAEYRETNQRMNWSDVLETVKSNALMRLCKDLGIASECWNKRFAESFKVSHCFKVFRQGANKPQWRLVDSEPFYNETGIANDSPNRDKYGKATIQPTPKAPVNVEKPKAAPAEQATVAGQAVDTSTGEVVSNLPSEPLQAPTVSFDSPQGVIDAAHAAIGQVYYKAPAHAYNALRKELGSKWTWPKPGNKEGWNEAYEFLVYHAKNEAALAQAA